MTARHEIKAFHRVSSSAVIDKGRSAKCLALPSGTARKMWKAGLKALVLVCFFACQRRSCLFRTLSGETQGLILPSQAKYKEQLWGKAAAETHHKLGKVYFHVAYKGLSSASLTNLR